MFLHAKKVLTADSVMNKQHKHSNTNVSIFRVISFNAFWKFLWVGNLEWEILVQSYRKIRKISPWAYIFPRPFFEELIFGGAYIRRGLSREGNLAFQNRLGFTFFPLFYFLFEDKFLSTSPRGLIFGGAI